NSPTVAKQTTPRACARRSSGKRVSATRNATHVSAPSPSCSRKEAKWSARSSVARYATVANPGTAARATTGPEAPLVGAVQRTCGLCPCVRLNPGQASTAELELVPGGNGCELEQRPPAARVLVGELGVALVPDDLERAALHLVIEPRAAEDQLAQPVDERLPAYERHAFPVAREVAAEPRLRRLDHSLRGEGDE